MGFDKAMLVRQNPIILRYHVTFKFGEINKHAIVVYSASYRSEAFKISNIHNLFIVLETIELPHVAPFMDNVFADDGDMVLVPHLPCAHSVC
mgnify:CR=1 FL=1